MITAKIYYREYGERKLRNGKRGYHIGLWSDSDGVGEEILNVHIDDKITEVRINDISFNIANLTKTVLTGIPFTRSIVNVVGQNGCEMIIHADGVEVLMLGCGVEDVLELVEKIDVKDLGVSVPRKPKKTLRFGIDADDFTATVKLVPSVPWSGILANIPVTLETPAVRKTIREKLSVEIYVDDWDGRPLRNWRLVEKAINTLEELLSAMVTRIIIH